MTMRTFITSAAVAALVASGAPAAAQSLPAPASWKWVTDAPARHQTALRPPEDAWLFGVMAPGWHITTRPAAVLYEPSYVGTGRFVLEAETFLFPGTSDSGLGLLVGGTNLEGPAASYTAFLIRRDGRVSVERRAGGRTERLVDWAAASGAVAGKPDTSVRNLLRLEVEAGVARLLVNGTVAVEVPRPAAEFRGIVGLRIGADVDVHVSSLDLTLKLAEPRPTR
ncbi:MAG: hypothetical protein AB7O28_27555 [Vicinamibacterales bacterium]